MKKYCICLLLTSWTFGQEILWQKEIEKPTQDLLSNLSITIDRQYLLSGSSLEQKDLSFDDRNNVGYNYRLVKLNSKGEKIWDKSFGGNSHDYLTTTTSTQEGGFFIAGKSYSEKFGDKLSDNYGGSDIWLIKLDENGEEEWQKSIGTKMNDEVYSVVQTPDMGYFIGGGTQIKEGLGSKDVWIIRLDNEGNQKQHLFLGGKGIDQLETMIPTRDGGVLLGIYSKSGIYDENIEDKYLHTEEKSIIYTSDKSNMLSISKIGKKDENYGEGDYWIVKLNKEGKVEWQRSYGGKGDDKIRALSLTDSGYLLAGESRSDISGTKSLGLKGNTDLWLISIDNFGNEIWQKSYSLGEVSVLMSIDAIWDNRSRRIKGFLQGGYTIDNGKIKYNLLYIDSKGERVWQKYINNEQKQERLVSAIMMGDGSYILTGTSAKEIGKENWKIIKLGDKEIENLIEKKELKVYPNPVSDYVYVELGIEFNEAEISIYDMGGRQMQKMKTNQKITKLNTSQLPMGIYIINAITENQKLNAKIFKR